MPVKCNHSSVQALFVGMGPLLPSQGEKLSSLAGTILWERAMPEKCNHTNVQAVFVGMAHSYQGEKLSVLAGTILWERAMPVKCNHSSVQALFVGMAHSYQAKAGSCPPWLAPPCGNGPCP